VEQYHNIYWLVYWHSYTHVLIDRTWARVTSSLLCKQLLIKQSSYWKLRGWHWPSLAFRFAYHVLCWLVPELINHARLGSRITCFECAVHEYYCKQFPQVRTRKPRASVGTLKSVMFSWMFVIGKPESDYRLLPPRWTRRDKNCRVHRKLP